MSVPLKNEQSADKGLLGGKCNRTACTTRPATWWSPFMKAHYCGVCACRINQFVPLASDQLRPVAFDYDNYEVTSNVQG
jgi:hypothetical protein